MRAQLLDELVAGLTSESDSGSGSCDFDGEFVARLVHSGMWYVWFACHFYFVIGQ